MPDLWWPTRGGYWTNVELGVKFELRIGKYIVFVSLERRGQSIR